MTNSPQQQQQQQAPVQKEEEKFVNPLPQLLVSEAIRALEKKYENTTDKNTNIEINICNMAIKPGFAMTAQILRNMPSIDTIDDVCRFLTNRFSLVLFKTTAKYQLSPNKVLGIMFPDKLPSWFSSIMPANTPITPEQIFWFRSYAHFVLGLFTGALLHFGYKATPAIEKPPPNLSFIFRLEVLDGSWEFMSNAKH